MFAAKFFKRSSRRNAIKSQRKSNRAPSSRGRALLLEPLEQRQLLSAAPTVTSIVLSPTAITYGQSDTFTAHIMVFGAAQSSVNGSVQFYEDGTAFGPAQPLVNHQTASITDPKLSAGSHSIYAAFESSDTTKVLNSSSSYAGILVQKASMTLTADNQTMTYGGLVPTLTYTATGWVAGDNPSNYSFSTQPHLTTTVSSSSPAKQYVNSIMISGASDPNYSFSYAAGTFTVTPAVLTLVAQNQQMMYGAGALPTLTYIPQGLVNGDTLTGVLASMPSISTTATAISHVSLTGYPILVSGATLKTPSNYTLAYQPGVLAITPRPLTISANPAAVTYGYLVAPTLQWSASGYGNGDNNSIFSSPPTAALPLGCHVGRYSVPLSSGTLQPISQNDYTITTLPVNVTVNPASLILKASDATIYYGSTSIIDPNNFSAIGLVNGDTLADIEDTTTDYFYGPDSYYYNQNSVYPQYGNLVNEGILTQTNIDLPYPGPSVTLSGANGFSQPGVYPGAITFGPFSTPGWTGDLKPVDPTGSFTANDATYWNWTTGITSGGNLIWTREAWTMAYGAIPTNVPIPNYQGTGPNLGETEWVIDGAIRGQGMLEKANTNSVPGALPGQGYLDYNITYQTGTLTVLKQTVNVVFHNQQVTYGDPLPALTDPSAYVDEDVTVSGLMDGATIESIDGGLPISDFITTTANFTSYTYPPSGPTLQVCSSDVGSYQIGSSFPVNSDYYNVNFTFGTLSVTPRTLDITANPQSVTYGEIGVNYDANGNIIGPFTMPDETPSAYTVADPVLGDPLSGTFSSGLVLGDQIDTSSPILFASDYHAGTAAINVANVVLAAGSNGTAADYALNATSGIATINQATLSITTNNQTVTYGDVTVNDPSTADYQLQTPTLPIGATPQQIADFNTQWAGSGWRWDGSEWVDSDGLVAVGVPLDPADPNSAIVDGFQYHDSMASLDAVPTLKPAGYHATYDPVTDPNSTYDPYLISGSGLLLSSDYRVQYADNGLLSVEPKALTVSPADSQGNLTVTTSYGTDPTNLISFTGGQDFGNFNTDPARTLTSGLNSPYAMAFDSQGNLFVANNGANTVSEYDASGALVATLSVDHNPVALAVDSSGNLFVSNGDQVSVFLAHSLASGTTTLTADAILDTGAGSNPVGLAVDPTTDNLYVADFGALSGTTVSVLYHSTVASLLPGGGATVPADNTLTVGTGPYALAFSSTGNLYVANTVDGTVSEFLGSSLAGGSTTADYTLTTGTGTPFVTRPSALVCDASGDLFVANSGDNTVSEFLGSSLALGSTTPDFTSTSPMNDPWALAVDARGNLYVANNGYGTGTTVSVFIPGTISGAASAVFSTGVNGPEALAIDAAGNLYVANAGNNTVSVFAAAPKAQLSAGLDAPSAAAMDAYGNLFVANSNAGTVSEFDSSGAPVATLSVGANPVALAFDSSGDLCVANSGDNTVSVFLGSSLANGATSPDFVLTGSAGAPLDDPEALAFDPTSGNLYVANYGASAGTTVSVFSPALGLTTPVATLTGLIGPHALAFDANGDLFVANQQGATVSVFDHATLSSLALGASVAEDSELAVGNSPSALVFDASGNLFVANAVDNTISEFAPGATTATTFSSPEVNDPVALAVDASGNLYVANAGDSLVSAFAPGNISGAASAVFSSGVNGPVALWVAANGDLYVTNQGDSTVSVFAAAKSQLQYAGAAWADSLDTIGLMTGALGTEYYDVASSSWQPLPSPFQPDAGNYQLRTAANPDLPSVQALAPDYILSLGDANLVVNKAQLTLTPAMTDGTVDPNTGQYVPIAYDANNPTLQHVGYDADNYNYDQFSGNANSPTGDFLMYNYSGLAPWDSINNLADNGAGNTGSGYDDLSMLDVAINGDQITPVSYAGTYPINFVSPPSQDGTIDLKNYTIVDSAPANLAIDPAQLTVQALDQGGDPALTGDIEGPYSYGGQVPGTTPGWDNVASDSTVMVSGLWGSDTFDDTQLSLLSPDATQNPNTDGLTYNSFTAPKGGFYNAGTYTIDVQGPVDLGNYTVSYYPGTLTIGQAQLEIQVNDLEKDYGVLDPANLGANVTYTDVPGNGLVNDGAGHGDTLDNLGLTALLQTAINNDPTDATTATVSAATGYFDAGTWNLSVANLPGTPSGTQDYAIIGYSDGTLQIDPATLKITPNNQEINYGQDPDLSITSVGWTGLVGIVPGSNLPGDSLDSLGIDPTALTMAATTDQAGTIPVPTNPNSGWDDASPANGTWYLTLSGGPTTSLDGDYNIVYDAGDLTISPATLTINATSESWTYGQQPLSAMSAFGAVSEFDSSGAAVATLTGVAGPHALAYDTAGDLFAADYYTGTVSEFSAAALAGGSTTPDVTLDVGANPVALAFDSSGDLFVANSGDNTVSEFTAASLTSGGTTLAADATLTVGKTPMALATDASGDLFVANSGANTVSEFDATGTLISTLTVGSDPVALAYDLNTGNLYVANSGDNTVSEFTAASLTSGAATLTPDATLTVGTTPVALTVDGYSDLFVANSGDATVSEFYATSLTSGAPTLTADATLTVGRSPMALAFDSSGDLFVANSRDGTASEFLGTSLLSGSTTPDATLNVGANPVALAVDGSDNLFVANYGGMNVTVSGTFVPPKPGFTGDNLANTVLTSQFTLSAPNDSFNLLTNQYHAGSSPITVSGPDRLTVDHPDYVITYNTNPGTLNVSRAALTVQAGNQTYNYGGADGHPWPTQANLQASAVDASPHNLVPGDSLASEGITPTLKVTPRATPQSHVLLDSSGNVIGYPIYITGEMQSQDYQISYSQGGRLTITPANTLVLTADSKGMTYGGTTLPTLTYHIAGFVNGDSLASLPRKPLLVTAAQAATASTKGSDAGVYGINFDAGNITTNYTYSAYDPDYSGTYASGKLTVLPATLTVTAASKTMAYGSYLLPSLTYLVSGLVNHDTQINAFSSVPFATTTAKAASTTQPGVGSHVAGSPYPIYVGNGVVRLNSNGVYNYTVRYVSGRLTVTPVPLRLVADPKWMLQGTDPASLPLTYHVLATTPLRNGDTLASLTRPPVVTTTATASSVPGTYPITVGGALDKDYTISYTGANLVVGATSNAVYLMPDPYAPGQDILYAWGSNANDNIVVNPYGAGGTTVTVLYSGVSRGIFGPLSPVAANRASISRIVIHGVAGQDTIGVSQYVTLSAWLYGDNGSQDNLSGGGGPTYLFGGSGLNMLLGGKGRSIIIGGVGSGKLTDGSGDTILIGGTTDYNPASLIDTSQDQALMAILAEWNSTQSYSDRISYLTGGASGGLNGPWCLTSDLSGGTVNDNNGAHDILVYGHAAVDLLFASGFDTVSPLVPMPGSHVYDDTIDI